MSGQDQEVWVLGMAHDIAFGTKASHVREMITLDGCVAQPNAPAVVRGLLNLRGRILTLFDARALLGQTSAALELETLCALINDKKLDHERWLQTLEISIRESVPFPLARDPGQCAFGRWRSSFTTEHAVLRMQLEKVDVPHRKIHALADELLTLANHGRIDDALTQLEQARQGLLHELIGLLDETIRIVRHEQKEIVLVLDRTDSGLGVIVDSVVGVRAIERAQIESVAPGSLGAIEAFLAGIARIEGRTYLLLDFDRLLAPYEGTNKRG